MRKVQNGPPNREANHQPSPLLPFACARPALIRESVNHPTAYSPVFVFMADVLFAQAETTVDYKSHLQLETVAHRRFTERRRILVLSNEPHRPPAGFASEPVPVAGRRNTGPHRTTEHEDQATTAGSARSCRCCPCFLLAANREPVAARRSSVIFSFLGCRHDRAGSSALWLNRKLVLGHGHLRARQGCRGAGTAGHEPDEGGQRAHPEHLVAAVRVRCSSRRSVS